MTSLNQVPAVATALLYGSLSLAMAFLNKMLISQFSFNYPFFILFCQMLLAVIILEIMKPYKMFGLPSITFSNIKMFAFPSMCYSLHATLSLAALEGMNIPMYGAVKRCTPLVNLVLAVYYLKKPSPSPLVLISVLTITLGCLIAGLSDPSFNGMAYSVGGASVVLQALYQTLVQQCGHNKMSPLHILRLNSCISVFPFLLLTCLRGELSAVLNYPHLSDGRFVCLVIAVVGLGLLLNLSLFLCTIMTSALTTSIVGVIKSAFQTIIGFFAFGGIIFHPVNMAGIILNSLGGVMYTYAKYMDREIKPIVVEDMKGNLV